VPFVRIPGPLVFLDLKTKFRSNVDKAHCYELEVIQTAWVLRRIACWDCRLESRWGHGCFSCERCVLYR